MATQPWKLRYAPHLGFLTRDTPWFRETLGTIDPVVHIEHIAGLGFAGVGDKDLLLRPPAEQERMGEALARNGLEMGSFSDMPQGPYLPWASRDADDIAQLRAALDRCIEAARRVGGGTACLTPAGAQGDALSGLAANLAWAAERAEAAGIGIAVEPISRARVPDALLRSATVAHGIVTEVASPAIGLIFDTLHSDLEGEDLKATWPAISDRVSIVQIADRSAAPPVRVEPGTGSIDLTTLLRAMRAGGFSGLVELEHFHSRPGREGEAASLAALARLDAAL